MMTMKKKGIVAIIAALFVIIVLGASIDIVNENEFKLVKRFGKVDRVITDAGVCFLILLCLF